MERYGMDGLDWPGWFHVCLVCSLTVSNQFISLAGGPYAHVMLVNNQQSTSSRAEWNLGMYGIDLQLLQQSVNGDQATVKYRHSLDIPVQACTRQ
jgi:hypothetical protein